MTEGGREGGNLMLPKPKAHQGQSEDAPGLRDKKSEPNSGTGKNE